MSNAADNISLFDKKHRAVLDDASCQSDADRPVIGTLENFGNVLFFPIGSINNAIDKIEVGIGWDGVSNSHLENIGPIFRNLICRFFNKSISHNNIINKAFSDNYKPIMNSLNFSKMFEYCLLSIMNRYFKLDSCQFTYRQNTICLSVVVIVKETLIKPSFARLFEA